VNHLTIFQTIAAVIIGVLSVARTARLVVWDDYPPTMWLRMKWDDLTERSSWNKLLHCQFCLCPYLATGNLGWAIWSGLWFHGWGLVWWIANGIWAGSYLAATYVAYDESPGD
jgi:hypothetical protein